MVLHTDIFVSLQYYGQKWRQQSASTAERFVLISFVKRNDFHAIPTVGKAQMFKFVKPTHSFGECLNNVLVEVSQVLQHVKLLCTNDETSMYGM